MQLPAGEIKSVVQRVCLDDGQKPEVSALYEELESAGSAPSSHRVSHWTGWVLHVGKWSQGHSWDKEQRALASPVPTVTRNLALRGGAPCPVQARTIFDLATQVR